MASAPEHLSTNAVPKLLRYGTPRGALVTDQTVAWFRERLPGLDLVDTGGPAGRFIPEDRPI